MSYSIGFAKGGREDIALQPYEVATFKELAKPFATPLVGEKGTKGYFIRGGDLELYSTYETSGGHTYTNIYPRCDAALKTGCLLILDIDKGKNSQKAPTLDEVSQVLKLLKLNHFGYTTASHTTEIPKCRIVIPCKLSHKNSLIPTLLVLKKELGHYDCYPDAAGAEERTWSIPWFFPTETENFHFIEWHEGEDFKEVLDSAGVLDHLPPKSIGKTSSVDEMINLITTGAKDTGVHQALNNVIHGLLEDGVAPAFAEALVKGLLKEGSDHHKDYFKDIPRLIKAKANKIKNDWTEPRPLEEFLTTIERPQFPLMLLPYTMQEAAVAIASYHLTLPENIGPLLILMVSMSIHRKALIEIDQSEIVVPFHLSMIFLAKSGEFKSSIYKVSTRGLVRGEGELHEVYKRDKQLLERKAEMAKKFKEDIKKKKPRNQEAVPSFKELMTKASADGTDLDAADTIIEAAENLRLPGSALDSVTEEKAVMQCYEQGGYGNYLAPEAQAFFQLLSGLYDKTPSKTDFFIRGTVGDPYSRKRAGSDSLEFNPVLNTAIFGQPDVYAAHTKNEMMYSTGFNARLLPLFWHTQWIEKTTENAVLDKDKLAIYTHVLTTLSSFVPDISQKIANIETIEKPPAKLIQPCTKIKGNSDSLLYIQLFKDIRKECAPGGKWEGQWELLNKSITMGYTMAACCYAYDHFEDFYEIKEHEQNRIFFNLAKAFTYYIIDSKLVAEIDVKRESTLSLAKKLLKVMLSSSQIEEYRDGMKVTDFNNKMKNYGGNTPEEKRGEQYLEALELLIQFGYLKVLPVSSEKSPRPIYYYFLNRKCKSMVVKSKSTKINIIKLTGTNND